MKHSLLSTMDEILKLIGDVARECNDNSIDTESSLQDAWAQLHDQTLAIMTLVIANRDRIASILAQTRNSNERSTTDHLVADADERSSSC